MTARSFAYSLTFLAFATGVSLAHDTGAPHGEGAAGMPAWFAAPGSTASRGSTARSAAAAPWARESRPSRFPNLRLTSTGSNALAYGVGSLLPSLTLPAGNGVLLSASFAPFKPKVRFHWDESTFYMESDNTPAGMPNLMVGITSWQQQIPLPAAYFANSINNENSSSSLGYGQPNYWRLPLVPTPASSPLTIFTPGSAANNFQRGAIAIAANGIAIFNPANNRGDVAYEIGELDLYGGHCGLGDDYHYHIIPTHLLSAFGGPLGNDKPVAWALDGYPIYGFLEPDGSARQALDSEGGHDHGSWGYHYHAVGTMTTDSTHPYGTPQSPYTMTTFHGTVVNYGGQVDGQPEVAAIRADGVGGYNAKAIAGASIVAWINPAALTTDSSGNYIQNTATGAATSADAYIMRVAIGGINYDQCWTINRKVNPRTLTTTWRAQGLVGGALSGSVVTTTTTYSPIAGSAAADRLTAYPMGAWSELKLPDTSQVADTTATYGEDSDYAGTAQSFTDNGNNTITDNVTGLMWQKTDNGESTWENAVTGASSIATGGYSDWRLPSPAELFSLFNFENNNPALNTTYFPSNGAGADYWWSRDAYGSSTTNVWCANTGGGLGSKPKSETISAGGAYRYHARYVRTAQNSSGHNYVNNLDGTITDSDTSLMWAQVPATATTWTSALTAAESLTLGGYSDWRLPNIKELQTLTDYSLATGTVAAGLKPCINRTLFAKTLTGCATTAASTTVTCADTTGLLVGMPIVDPVSVAGSYISNSTAPTIVSVGTGSFVISSAATAAGSGLTLRALALPTAYWSSTSLNGDSTKAWLLELGINSSVLAANGPSRTSQGIISYEAKTSAYPVFAVRGTSVTTQIVVAQPATTALTDGVSVVGYGNVTVGYTLEKTFTITNSGTSSLTISGVTIDGTNSALFTLTSSPAATILPGGSTTLNVQFDASTVGSKTAALHIASSDTAVGTAFDITLSGTGYVPPPTVSNVTASLTSPTNADSVYVTAQVTPATGATVASVALTYDTGAQTTAKVFGEVFALGSSNSWSGALAQNLWTTVGSGATRLANGASNHTTPISLTACATTSGSATLTCASTTALFPGMTITGTNVPASSKILSITNATTFVMTTNATGTGSALTLAVNGSILTNCTTTASSTTVTCASTVGLVANMGLSGTGLANDTTVSSVTNATTFVISATPITPGSALTLTATGCAAEFLNGSVNLTDSMFTTTAAINTVGSAGTVDFWVQTRDLAATNNNGWAFQVSPDGGTTWNTRLSENWSSKTVNLTNCVFNGAGAGVGSTTVTCASTTGLAAGQSVSGGTAVNVTGSVTNGSAVVTCSNTTGLVVGMFAASPGNTIAPGARILSIVAGTSFTLSANAVGTNAALAVAATYLDSNATVTSVTNSTTFIISTAAFVNTTALPLTAVASSINHGYQQFSYVLDSSERTATMKMRWQYAGYTATPPARAPRVNVDDIAVNVTTGLPSVTVTMFDDGLHGDGSAGDGVYGALLPVQSTGTTVSYAVAATDSNGSSTTLATAGSYLVGTAVALDAPVLDALPASTLGASQTVTWPAITGATSYTVQRAATADFTSVLAAQTVSTPSAVFAGLSGGIPYYYRAKATSGSSTSAYSNVVSSTQDVAITETPTLSAPATGNVTKSPVTVTFQLPEAASTGSVKLSFGTGTLVLATTQESAGTHTFTFDPANPVATSGGAVASIASGSIADGTYIVTLAYQDVAGNPVASVSTTNVMIDTTTPTVSGLFSPVTVYASTALANYTSQMTVTDASTVTRTQLPLAGSTLTAGVTTVTLTATDAAGNAASTGFSLYVRPVSPPSSALVTQGMAAPGAGGASGLPADAKLASFSAPAIDDAGDLAYVAKWTSVTKGSGTGLFKNSECVAILGGAIPGGGATFRAFTDPVVDAGGVVFHATLAGCPAAQASGVFSDVGGTLSLIARAGGVATPDGATFRTFRAVAADSGNIAVSAQLNPGSGVPKITSATDLGVWVKSGTGTLTLVLNEGQDVFGQKIKTLITYMVGNGSPGQGRGWLTTPTDPQAGALVVFTDNTRAILSRQPAAPFVISAHTGVTSTGYPPDIAGATFATFGPPAFAGDAAVAFRGTLTVGSGGVTKAYTSGIFARYAASATTMATIARVGADAGSTGAKFTVLKDPVLSSDLGLAFPATISGGLVRGLGLTTLWWKPAGGTLTLLAQGGTAPVDLPGAQWRSFPSLAIAANRGPIFTGTLLAGKGGVTSATASGVWATDFLGTPRLLFRTGVAGAVVTGKTLKSFALLTAKVGSVGVTRSFNNVSQVIWLATFTDKTQAIVVTEVP